MDWDRRMIVSFQRYLMLKGRILDLSHEKRLDEMERLVKLSKRVYDRYIKAYNHVLYEEEMGEFR